MTVVATEDFSGAAGPLNGTQTTTGGLVWQAFGVYAANRNTLQRDGAGMGMSVTGQGLAYVNAGSASHYAQIQQYLAMSSYQSICAVVAAVDLNNFIMLTPFYGGPTYKLVKRVDNIDTDIAVFSGLTLTPGDVFRLERDGTTVKAFQNGVALGNAAGYTVADAVFSGCTNAGLWTNSTPGAGAFDNFEAGTLGAGGGGGTLTLATAPLDGAVLQRAKGGTSKAIVIGGAYTGAAPNDVQWRLETEAAALVPGYDWATIAGATIGAGAWSASVTVPQDSARTGYKIKVRSRDAGGAVIDEKASPSFTVGVLVECAGQSNMEAQFNGVAAGPGLSGKCAWWSGSQWLRASSAQITAAIATLSDLLGLPVGFASTAVSASSARQHAPAHTSTDGAVPAGQYWASFTTLLASFGGDLEGCIWYQGEANVGGDMQQYKDAVNARIAGIKASTGRTGAGEYSFGIVVIGKYSGQSDASVQAMRATQAEIASATPGAFLAADAVYYGMADAVHLAPAEYVQIGYAEGRSMAVARGAATYDGRGPRVSGASIVGSTVTVTVDLNGSTALSGSGGLTGWEWYDGASWAAATDAAVAGNQVTFSAAGAQQVRYLYGAAPATTNLVRGNVKAHANATSTLALQPTRAPIAVTAGVQPVYVRPLIWDGQRMRRMGPGDVIDPAIKALFT